MLNYDKSHLQLWPHPPHHGVNIDKSIVSRISITEIRDLLLINTSRNFEDVNPHTKIKFLTHLFGDSVWLIMYIKGGLRHFYLTLGYLI